MKNLKRLLILLILSLTFINCAKKEIKFSDCKTAFERGNYYYYEKSDYQNALFEYLEVPENSEEYVTAQRYIGYNIYCREYHQYSKGLPYLEKAYKLNPEDIKVLEDLGRCYVELGQKERGKELLLKANTKVAKKYLKNKKLI